MFRFPVPRSQGFEKFGGPVPSSRGFEKFGGLEVGRFDAPFAGSRGSKDF